MRLPVPVSQVDRRLKYTDDVHFWLGVRRVQLETNRSGLRINAFVCPTKKS
jgi:hypothetical protein